MKTKKYIVLDCETATNPLVKNYKNTQKVAIAKPLIYDIAWQVMDRKGKIYKSVNYLVSEIFSVPDVFNTAYYKEKRPIYLKMLKDGKITIKDWNSIISEFMEDIQKFTVEGVGAYNAMFDFKKAIQYTERYIKAVYSNYYEDFQKKEKESIERIMNNSGSQYEKEFNPHYFTFREETVPLFDIWGLACKVLLNNSRYKNFCKKNNLLTASKKYYSTNAENCFRYVMKDWEFKESHTALDDTIIECKILEKILQRGKLEFGILYFPFRILGNP